MIMMASSVDRVPAHTSPAVNQRIRRSTEAMISFYARNPERIGERLAQLDQEWDIERAIEMQSSGLILAGTLLGLFVDKRFLIVPAVVSAFLMQHAVQGWCPPVPVMRRLGLRTPQEIEAERCALRALRGDFKGLEGEAGGDIDSRIARAVELMGKAG